eukprot:CAMPEP_0173408562 /NCGR_PEP_ID=MMETSP1356-20130122/70050_1 /TAXON_ID=77927 ORGANISM="Hemiselmis virescens, Strain PCC157" /NCGR_SAMPLE_ID=MMETSP1356 /ASSEMBLY_ACC=CAM_ASM_000847 /LENGTH=32 /DNA_ID= /DNA_START= /DNA_END= /DNA_ORIENTATION=
MEQLQNQRTDDKLSLQWQIFSLMQNVATPERD